MNGEPKYNPLQRGFPADEQCVHEAILHVAARCGEGLDRAIRIGTERTETLAGADIIAMMACFDEGVEELVSEEAQRLQRRAQIKRLGQAIGHGIVYGMQCLNPAFFWPLKRYEEND